MNGEKSEDNLKDDLNKLHNEGKPLRKIEITDCINQLRRNKKFTLALQVSNFLIIQVIKYLSV